MKTPTTQKNPFVSITVASSLGRLTLVASERGLAGVRWATDEATQRQRTDARERAHHPVLERAARQLGEYFEGRRRTFDLPLDLAGTDFQRRVWQALLTIPYGSSRSYGDVARQIDQPSAVRAVGGASRRNPLAIIVPCHRVVGADGSLTGFAGGLAAKSHLLRLEQRHGVSPVQMSLLDA